MFSCLCCWWSEKVRKIKENIPYIDPLFCNKKWRICRSRGIWKLFKENYKKKSDNFWATCIDKRKKKKGKKLWKTMTWQNLVLLLSTSPSISLFSVLSLAANLVRYKSLSFLLQCWKKCQFPPAPLIFLFWAPSVLGYLIFIMWRQNLS